MKHFYLIICLMLFSAPIFGQQIWTLEECMRYAVEHSPRTATAEARHQISKQNYQQALASLLPSIGASTNATFNFGRAIGDDNTYSSANTLSNAYSLYASMTLFQGLSAVNRVRMEKVNRLSGKHNVQYEQDMVAYETMEAFFNVLYYKQTVALALEQLAESTRNLEQTERMAELGLKGYPDVAEMRAQEAGDKYTVTQQKNLLAIGTILLKEKMNFPIDQQLEIADYACDTAVSAEASDPLAIYQGAVNYNPRALGAEADLLSSEYSFKMARGGLLPTLSMNGGIGTNFFKYRDDQPYVSFRDQFRDKRGEYFGFSLSVPIFDGLSRRSTKKRSRYQLHIARNQHEQTLRSLYSEIEQAVADVNGQADEYSQATRQADAVEAAHEVNRRKYEQGLVSALELHTSANRLLDARVQLRNSQLRYQLKYRLLEYYKGKPFITEIEINEK